MNIGIEKVNQIFRSKFPEGEIREGAFDGEKLEMYVCFGDNIAHCYICNDYYELLNRLGFKVAFIEDVESTILSLARAKRTLKEIEENIAKNGVYVDEFFGAMPGCNPAKSEREAIAYYTKKIQEYQGCVLLKGGI